MMRIQDAEFEIFLQPGEVYFGGDRACIRTLLGSCVAISVWHPLHRIGGMCHYLLPQAPIHQLKAEALDGRYADQALALLLREMRRASTLPGQYQVKVFGGSNMFPGQTREAQTHVGARNVQAARALLLRHEFRAVAEHLGGVGHRTIVLDTHTGDAWVRHQRLHTAIRSTEGACATSVS